MGLLGQVGLGSSAGIQNVFGDVGGAVSDLFAADAFKAKAAGARFEQQNYLLASTYADQNEKFTETSTAIKQAQLARENTKMLGGQEADIASAGFSESGSALDLMRDSAAQGALTKAVAGQQGLITEAGYKEQSESYQNMAKAAQVAIDADEEAASGAGISAVIKGVAGIASLFTGLPISGAVDVVGGAAKSAVGDPAGIGGLY